MTFFSLMSTAISSILYGIVITAAIMAILYFILKTLGKGIVQSIVFYITGVVLAILLVIQFSLMIGAMQAKDAAESAHIYMNQMLENSSGVVTANESQQVLDTVIEQFPIIGCYIGLADFSGHNVSDLSDSIYEKMISYLSTYIWHRFFWILGIIVVAIFIALCFEKKTDNVSSTVDIAYSDILMNPEDL